MKKDILILYHSPCHDGFGAAFATWKKFGDLAEYIPVDYSQKVFDVPSNKEVYILDFSFPREELMRMAAISKKLTVLDHHVTAKKDLEGLSFAVFDMNRSGAGIAWDTFHGSQSRPQGLNYIEDRDLWKFVFPETKAYCAALATYPFDFLIWDKILQTESVADLLKQGEAILKYEEALMARILETTTICDFLGFKNVPVVYSQILQSEIGNKLLEVYPECPFSVVYFQKPNGRWKWSLRSTNNRQDVGLIASKWMGGGHRNAAGIEGSVDLRSVLNQGK